MIKLLKLLSNKEKGKQAEVKAANYLKQKGYKVITSNYKARTGEVDIIALKGKTLVFVEVKSSLKADIFSAVEKVDEIKKRKIIQTAKVFLQSHPELFQKVEELRFDVIVVTKEGTEVTHYEHAFFEE